MPKLLLLHKNRNINNITVLSIDPSIRTCGWALLINGIILAGLARSTARRTPKAILEIYRFLSTICPPNLHYLVIEKPIITNEWTKEKKENVAKLLASYDRYITLGCDNTTIWTPTVPEWKGQLSKDICWSRANKVLKDNNIKYEIQNMYNIPKDLLHNVHDAIALLVRFLQKERFID